MHYLVFLAIFLLSLGGLGGSLQPARLVILFMPVLIPYVHKLPHLKYNKLIKFGLKVYMIWVIYGITSLLWSPSPRVGLSSEIIVMSIGMISLAVFPFFLKNDEKSAKLIRFAWIAALVVTIPVALYEIATLNHFMYADEDRIIGGVGVNAPFAAVFFGNYNNYCVHICLCMPFLLWGILDDKSKTRKIIYIIILFLSIFIIMINTNRTSMLILFLYFISLFRFKFRNIAILVTFLAILLFSYSYLPQNFRDSIELLFNNRVNVDYGTDTSTTIRTGVYESGFDFLSKTYGLGVGAGGFEYNMLRSDKFMGIENPHNFFIEIISQYGVFIFLLFVAWLFAIAKKIYQNQTITSNAKRVFVMAVIAIPVAGVINSDAIGYTYWWVYISSLAMIASIGNHTLNTN